MDQISKTVNTFLSYIVGIGLICFFSFVFLLASARLNNSTLGGLLAQSAGETAKMARSESFSFWGQVGQQVASGLGVPAIGATPTALPLITSQAPTQAAPGPTSVSPTQAPPATQVPTSYIRQSGLSYGGLNYWQGLDADGKTPLATGASLESARNQAEEALKQNPGDMLGAWLLSKWKVCEPYLIAMRGNWADPQEASKVIQGADDVINKCNPRVYEAYAVKRWAELTRWAALPSDKRPEDDVPDLMAGLKVFIGPKVDGAARVNDVRDHVTVTFDSPGFNLPGNTITVTINTVNTMMRTKLGDANGWQLAASAVVPHDATNFLFPDTPPAVVLPTDAELNPPAVAPPAAKVVQPNAQGTPLANPGQYTVQAGDTVYGIARKFGVTPDALVAANPTTLGYNPNYITPGMVLNIPAATP